METAGNGSSWRQCKRWISLSVMLWMLLRLDGTLADCPSFKDKIIEVNATNITESITSPNYENDYPKDCVAKWRITSDREVVKFNIDYASFDDDSCNDNLTFYDGYNSSLSEENMIFSICKAPSPRTIHYVTSSKYLEIVFKSDSINAGGNMTETQHIFFIDYQAEDTCECNGPPTILSADNTTKSIATPRNPYNCRCQWSIQSDRDVVIFTIDVHPYLVYFNASCLLDYVKVYDGSKSTNTTLQQLCYGVKSNKRTFYTSTKDALVYFESDYSDPVLSFKIDYEARDVCDTEDWLGNFALPNVFKGFMPPSTCSWVLTSKKDFVTLEINIEFLKDSCLGDFIEVYNGNFSKVFWRHTCQNGTVEGIVVTSAGKSVSIKLHSAGGISDFVIRPRFTSDEEDDSDSLSGGIIAAIIIGSLLMCVLIAILAMLYYRFRKHA